MVRQLAERTNYQVIVQLFWNDSAPPGRDVFVEYRDERTALFFTLYPPRDRVLEAFYHPNAYADGAMAESPDVPAAA